MLKGAPPELGLKQLSIKLLKGRRFGNHAGYGLEHLYEQHGRDLNGRDVGEFLYRLFGKPSEIYARKESGDVSLEFIHHAKPREMGVLQLREGNGSYSIVTAYPNTKRTLSVNGKKIWKSGNPSQNNSKQQADAGEPLSGDQGLQPPLEGSGSKSGNNINPFGVKSSGDNPDIQFKLQEPKPYIGADAIPRISTAMI